MDSYCKTRMSRNLHQSISKKAKVSRRKGMHDQRRWARFKMEREINGSNK